MASISSLPSLSQSSAPSPRAMVMNRSRVGLAKGCRKAEGTRAFCPSRRWCPEPVDRVPSCRRDERDSMIDRILCGGGATCRGRSGSSRRGAVLVEQMTTDEKLGCLDGDTRSGRGSSTWAPAATTATPGRPPRCRDSGVPGIEFADGPRGCVIGDATAFPVSMARGATFDPALEERIGEAIGLELRASGATYTGAVCMNLLRHPAWGRAQETYGEDPHHVGVMAAALDARAAAPRDGVHEALRAQLDGERPVLGRRHGRRASAARGVPAALRAGRGRGRRIGDERLQLGERRVVRRERHAAHLDPPRRVGLGRLRHLRLRLRAARRREVGQCRPRHRDAVPPAAGGRAAGRGRRRVAADRGRRRGGRTDRGDAAAVRARRSSAQPGLEVVGRPEHRELARATAVRSACCCATRHPLLPVDAVDVRGRVAVLGRLAAMRNLGDGGSSDVRSSDVVTPLDGLRGGVRRRTVWCTTSRTPRSPTAPTSSSSWSGTPRTTRASSSTTRATGRLTGPVPAAWTTPVVGVDAPMAPFAATGRPPSRRPRPDPTATDGRRRTRSPWRRAATERRCSCRPPTRR